MKSDKVVITSFSETFLVKFKFNKNHKKSFLMLSTTWSDFIIKIYFETKMNFNFYLSFMTVDRTGMNIFEMKVFSMYDKICAGVTQYKSE